jgi:hypothetical protein
MIHSFLRLISLALLAGLATAQSTGATGDWEVLGTPGMSSADVWCCQIAFDAADRPYVAYQDHSLGENPTSVKRFVNGAWSYVGAKGGASVGTGWYNHLAFDSAGTLYVASRDYGVSSKLNVRRATTGSTSTWVNAGPTGISSGEAHYTHIVVGGDDSVYAVYQDGANQNKATVRRYASGAWTTLGPAGFTANATDYSSLAIDKHGTVYVAFADRQFSSSSGDGKVTVMRYVAAQNAWQYVGAPGFTPTGGLNLRLALDNDGVPHVVYQEYHQRITVMKFVGGQWVRLGGSASGSDRPVIETESWRQWVSIDFDSQNAPYVCYQLMDQGRKAAVRKYSGGSWTAVGSIGFTPGSADYMAMAIDAYDRPHVAFRDSNASGKATVMRFAPSPYTYCTSMTSSVGCVPRITTSGTPSISDTAPFVIGATSIINQRPGILLYSLRPDHEPLGNGVMCLKTPWKRTAPQMSGGSATGADCTGAFAIDFNSVIRSGLNQSLVVGATVCAQYIYRDNPSPLGLGLTDAVRFQIRP